MNSHRIKEAILIVVSFLVGGVFTYALISGVLDNNSTSNSNSLLSPSCSSENCTEVVVVWY